MPWVVYISTWISLARSGLLSHVGQLPIELQIVDAVHREVVAQGRASGHADAEILGAAMEGLPVRSLPGDPGSVDAAVLAAAAAAEGLISNDAALGRRALNLAIPWLRTADLVVLAVRASAIDADDGERAIDALEASGRISQVLAGAYRRELR